MPRWSRTSSDGRGSSALNCSKHPPCLPLRPPNRNFVVPDHRHFPSVAMGEPLPLWCQPKNRLDYPPTYTVSTPKFLIPAFASTETTPTMDRTRPPGRALLRGSSLGGRIVAAFAMKRLDAPRETPRQQAEEHPAFPPGTGTARGTPGLIELGDRLPAGRPTRRRGFGYCLDVRRFGAASNATWLHTTAGGAGNGLAGFTLDANSGRHVHRHLDHRRPDPDGYPGRWQLRGGHQPDYHDLLGAESASGRSRGRCGQRLLHRFSRLPHGVERRDPNDQHPGLLGTCFPVGRSPGQFGERLHR